MDLVTILTDCAVQVNRAKPVGEDWQEPNEAWFEQFVTAVLQQIDVAIEDEDAVCPVCRAGDV